MNWNQILATVTTSVNSDVRQDIKFLFITFEESTYGEVYFLLFMAAVGAILILLTWRAIFDFIIGIIKLAFFIAGVPAFIYGVVLFAVGDADAVTPVIVLVIVYWIVLYNMWRNSRNYTRYEPESEPPVESQPVRKNRRRHRNAA